MLSNVNLLQYTKSTDVVGMIYGFDFPPRNRVVDSSSFMWRFIKMLLGLCLWPFAWSMAVSTYHLYQTSAGAAATDWAAWALPIGFLVWVVIFLVLPRPFRTYVLGHELTHALWALMMGARVGKLKVGKSGGHVELSKTNFVITLAPYFFPFYTALVIAAYYLAGNWLPVRDYQAWWMAAIGMTWSFHITFTIHMLTQCQPDIQEHGRIFSFTVIGIMNVLLIALMMVFLGEPQLSGFRDLLFFETSSAYQHTFHILGQMWEAIPKSGFNS